MPTTKQHVKLQKKTKIIKPNKIKPQLTNTDKNNVKQIKTSPTLKTYK